MTRKKNRLLKVGLPALLLLFAANHVEYHFRSRSLAEKQGESNTLVVRAEDGAFGHRTIGVDEDSLPGGGTELLLRFSTLADWRFDPENPQACPPHISALSREKVRIIGFMYPLEAGPRLRHFCLLRTTQTCCYGPRPQFNQYLFVELQEEVAFERLAPVVVEGTFHVDPKPEEGYIYRLEGRSVQPVAGEEPELDGAAVARREGLPLLDIGEIEKLREENRQEEPLPTPATLAGFDGMDAVVQGYLVGRSDPATEGVILGRYAWDGVARGRPPDIYNAIMVFPRDENEVPPLWKEKEVFVGTVRITRNPKLYEDLGIVSLANAVRGIRQGREIRTVVDAGPMLPVWFELLLLLLLLAMVFHGQRLPREG